MKRVLLSAFACDPMQGSEPSLGWNWAMGLAKMGFEVHCITRGTSKSGIKKRALPPNLIFHYVSLSPKLERLYGASESALYLYYLLWQWRAYQVAKKMQEDNRFNVVHHVTWGSLQMGSFMYKLDAPLIFGPAGGGQAAPAAFQAYFGEGWATEVKRAKASRILLAINPACRGMLKSASVVLASNEDTLQMAKSNGAREVGLALDPGLPRWFLPDENTIKKPEKGTLKLLWVGRFMARKGTLLLLDVMSKLRDHQGITLTLVGDGPTRDEFLAASKVYGLDKTVFWRGRVPFEEVRAYYADHDVFFFTSLRDSCPMQLVEAMAFGMPVVTLDLHGQGLIVDADRGIKCACSTPETAVRNLTSAILALYENPDLVERLSAGAFRFAADQVWETKIKSVVDRYY